MLVEVLLFASMYWQPQPLACGGQFVPMGMSVAHKTLPCGTRVRVTNVRNGKSAHAVVNDRGPFKKGRDIDLSLGLAQAIGFIGLGHVRVEYGW